MAEDRVSAKVVITLLVITIVLTLVSTWLTLTALTSANRGQNSLSKTDRASVSLTVLPPPNSTGAENSTIV